MSRVAIGLVAVALSLTTASTLRAQDTAAPSADTPRGEWLVTAGDCRGCHGSDLSGGHPVPSPIGAITATNITPDPDTGIGGWSLDQFTAVLREGKSPDHYLYPAMPYTSYTGLSDADISTMWDYLRNDVPAVSNDVADTDLPFPFKRWAMPAWNLLNLQVGQSAGAVAVDGEQLRHGRLLVETLGHCSACHTPRGQLMGPIEAEHLGGAVIDGWYAPDITPSETGIGRWTDAHLATFLKTGHVRADGLTAVAAGDMGTVVERSLSRLSHDDIDAMIAYLRAVPPGATTQPLSDGVSAPSLTVSAIEQPQSGTDALLAHASDDGARLYQSACASCHGATGKGSTKGGFPALDLVDVARQPDGLNLVQVITHGVNRKVGDNHAFMPGFAEAMTDAQIAATANYVRATFGGQTDTLGADEVKTIRAGLVDVPFLIENARWLAIAGIIAGLFVLALIVVGIARIGRRT